jgi:Mysoin-binding motif of peroxisomes
LSDLDLQEASLSCVEGEFEDKDSLRVLKLSMARLHVIRKAFLCCLLALDADGGKLDFLRWNTAVDEIHSLASIIGDAEVRLRRILSEEECKLVTENTADT